MIILEFCLILMIILSVKIQPVLVQTNAMHMPYILPKTERIRSFDYWTWSQVSIGKKSEEFNKGNTVCFHEANQIWKFYEDTSSIHLFKIPFFERLVTVGWQNSLGTRLPQRNSIFLSWTEPKSGSYNFKKWVHSSNKLDEVKNGNQIE